MTDEVVRVDADPVPDFATSYSVPMRDGVELATDVYLPSGEGPFEVVLARLPYDKNSRYMFIEGLAPHFTNRGYAFVVQDVRGKFRSGGETIGLIGEADDGYDSVEWITQQPWSNGSVALWGDSYFGFTQWAAVSTRHPAVKAISPGVTSTQLFVDHVDGPVADVPWMVMADYLSHYWIDKYIYEYELNYDLRPITAIFENAFARVGGRSRLYDMLVPETQTLDLYPRGNPIDARPIPTLHRVGWFDNLLIVSMRDYMALASTPGWDDYQYLHAICGDHETYDLSIAPIQPEDDHLTNEAALARFATRYLAAPLEFFDVFLKGLHPTDSFPRVTWDLGHVGRRQSEVWPPPEAREKRLLLSHLPSARDGAGVLGSAAASEGEQATWVHDPSDLIPSPVPNTFSFLLYYPDERDLLERDDVLCFTSEPYPEALDIAGPVDLWLTISSTSPSTDIFTKLFDVASDGSAHMILRGQACISDTTGTQAVRVELGHTGYRVRPGHRLTVAIYSSDYPEFVPHPGTGANRWTAVDVERSSQTLHVGDVTPTSLMLWTL